MSQLSNLFSRHSRPRPKRGAEVNREPFPQIISRRAPITPEQQKRRDELAERSKLIQERGVPAPASGTFGGKPKSEKAK